MYRGCVCQQERAMLSNRSDAMRGVMWTYLELAQEAEYISEW